MTRDIAPTLGYYKPALLHNKMFPGLQGTDKMSSSQPNSTIYTTDPPKVVRKKIMSAFTGGAVSVEEQRKTGGKPEVCSVFKYKFYLFEKDDKALDELYDRCRKGEILCGECKKTLADSIVTVHRGAPGQEGAGQGEGRGVHAPGLTWSSVLSALSGQCRTIVSEIELRPELLDGLLPHR